MIAGSFGPDVTFRRNGAGYEGGAIATVNGTVIVTSSVRGNKNHEFWCKNEELCIKDREILYQNDEFCRCSIRTGAESHH